MIELADVYATPNAFHVLYQLLRERPPIANISHQKLPSIEDHIAFVESRPYRGWYIIKDDGEIVGACYASKLNEIGVAILRAHQRKGYGFKAVQGLITVLKPLPAIPGRRSGRFLANIATHNSDSKRLFKKLGFEHINDVFAL